MKREPTDPEELRRRVKGTYIVPPLERIYPPPPHILRRWAEVREEEMLEDIEQDPMNPRNWNPSIRDRFLDAWWILRPGMFKQYHNEYKSVGYEMIRALRYEHPGIFERVWDELATMEIEEWHPPRP